MTPTHPMPVIRLAPARDRIIAAWAREVNQHKAEEGLPEKKAAYQDQDAYLNRYQSFRAEAAVADYLGIPAKIGSVHDGGDGGIDLVAPNGITVQVKWRGQSGRDLATDTLDFHHELRADLYVLCWPDEDGHITLVGWCWKADFLRRILAHPPTLFWKRGKKWVMPWRELRPMSDLLPQIASRDEEDEDEATDRRVG